MRIVSTLALSCLLPALAYADPGVAAVDDEPVSLDAARASRAATPPPTTRFDRRTPADTGELRSASVAAPMPARVDDGPSVAREHDVVPAHAVAATATATDNEVIAELAARQLAKETKRHQRAVDACVASAHKRAPSAAGSLTLDLDVADRKVQSVRVSDDGVHDAALAACVTQVARSFSFAIASAHLRWPVALR